MTITIQELAKRCDAEAQGGDISIAIEAAGDIMSAKAGQVTVLSDHKYKKYLQTSTASACFISNEFIVDDIPEGLVLLLCNDPEMSFITAVTALHPEVKIDKHISKRADIADNVTLGNDINIGPFSSIGQHCEIGDGCMIHPSVNIGNNVTMGKNCIIYPNVVIYDNSVIGNNVIIHSGSIIAADGFGYKFRNNEHIKVPHVGNVVIADNVEIGANTCIDRGALGATLIDAGSKIDNLVQIGHNNKIGKNVIICGKAGLAGSCEVGDGVILAAGVAVADHIKIGEHAIILARSGVANDVDPGAHLWGTPAKLRKEALKEIVALSKLPELLKMFKQLQDRVGKLEK